MRLQLPLIAAVSSLLTALALAVLPLVIADALPAAAQMDDMDMVSVQLGDYFLDPPELNVVAGQTITFQLENIGVTTHALEINGQGVELSSPSLAAGETTTWEVTFDQPGTYEVYCPLGTNGSHRARGMEGSLEVWPAAM